MPASRPCACNGNALLRPDGDAAIRTTGAPLPSAQGVRAPPADTREPADLADRQPYESPRFLLNAERLSEPSTTTAVPRAPFSGDGEMSIPSARIEARKAWANRARVMCRYQPCQLRTS